MHAFITGADARDMRDLGTLGGVQSRAFGLNDAGEVVGGSFLPGEHARAFITGPDGVDITDLNTLVDLPPRVFLTWAVDINNAGQVLAVGVVPEPEIYALFVAGLGLIGFMARRKKAQDLRRGNAPAFMTT